MVSWSSATLKASPPPDLTFPVLRQIVKVEQSFEWRRGLSDTGRGSRLRTASLLPIIGLGSVLHFARSPFSDTDMHSNTCRNITLVSSSERPLPWSNAKQVSSTAALVMHR